MTEALGFMLPAAIAAIVMSLPAIVIMIVMLEPGRDLRVPFMFTVGWLLSFVISCAVFVLTANALSSDSSDERSTWAAILLFLLGLGLLTFAWKKVRNRPRSGQPAKPSVIMKTVDKLNPRGAIILGAVLGGFNPKFLAVIASLSAELILTPATTGERAIVMALFIVIGSAGILGPQIAIRIAPDPAIALLVKLSDFLNKFTWLIMALIIGYFGVTLISDALRALS